MTSGKILRRKAKILVLTLVQLKKEKHYPDPVVPKRNYDPSPKILNLRVIKSMDRHKLKTLVNCKMSCNYPNLNFSDVCDVFKNCYPTVTNGFYSMCNSVLSDNNVLKKTKKKQ